MTVYDFHIHYTPENLVRERLGGKKTITRYKHGVPASTSHEGLFKLEGHIASMDAGGVDVALLSSAAAMDAPNAAVAREINEALHRDTRTHRDPSSASRIRPPRRWRASMNCVAVSPSTVVRARYLPPQPRDVTSITQFSIYSTQNLSGSGFSCWFIQPLSRRCIRRRSTAPTTCTAR